MQHSGGYWKDDGTWWFSAAGEKAIQSQDIYHCTYVDAGWSILEQSFIRNSVICSPQGVFGTADRANSSYDCGATIVMKYNRSNFRVPGCLVFGVPYFNTWFLKEPLRNKSLYFFLPGYFKA